MSGGNLERATVQNNDPKEGSAICFLLLHLPYR
jgi:hypothetical protein